tara:strand:- start:2642 stop:3460 length:819 start_codon:yes stop_codon:yes gene_type:complete
MAFKMKGFSPFNKGKAYTDGAMDYSKSAMPKAESPLTVKGPDALDGVKMKDRKGKGDQKGQTWTRTEIGKDRDNDTFSYADTKDARKSERKQRKADKLRNKADKLRDKKEGKSEKRQARLEKRASSKEIRADVKEQKAMNIVNKRDKNANVTDARGGQTPGMKHRVDNPKQYDADGKKVPGSGKKPKGDAKTTYSSDRAKHADSKPELKEFVKTDASGKKSLSSYDKAWDDGRFKVKDGKRTDKFGNTYSDDAAGKKKFVQASEAYWKKQGK